MIHSGPIAGIAAGGKFIATAGYDNQVILWDAERRQALARGCHDHLVNHCAFNSDASLLVSAGSDYSARIWEVPSLRLKAALIGHEDDVDMAVFSPDDQSVATCALDRTIRIFDLGGQCRSILRGHIGNILSVAWSRDGKRLVSSSVDGTVREWDVAEGRELHCHDLQVRTDSLEIDGDGRILAGDDQGRIAIILDGEISYTAAHLAGVKKVAFDEAAGILVTLSYDRSLAVWQIGSGREVQEIARTELPPLVWARAATLVGEGKIAVGTFGSAYGLFDWRSGQWDLEGIEAGGGLNAVTVHEGATYAVGDAGLVWGAGRPIAEMGSLCNFLLPLGPRLLTGGQLGQLFDARTGESLYTHHSPLNCGTSFVRWGQLHAAIGSYTGEILIFALESDGSVRLVETLVVYENAIKGLAANGGCLFSVCASTSVAWHDLADLTLIRRRDHAHERIANGCCLAGPQGFASIGRDRTLRLWLGDEEEVYQTPHPNSVKCICASDDGRTLMTGAYTGTLAGFDLPSRRWISFTRPTAAGISALAYDGQSRHFLASSYDGRLYRVV